MKNKITKEHLARVGFHRVEPSLLDGETRNIFLARLHAIELKLDGLTGAQIKEITNISECELSRFFKRYTTPSLEGLYWGEVALIPNARLQCNKRRKPLEAKRSDQKGGLAGALGYTLEKHPNILQRFTDLVFRRKEHRNTQGKKFDKSYLCNVFYDLCRSEGIKESEWPFNQHRGARKSVSTLIDKILSSDFARAALVTGGRTAQIHSKVGTGYEPFLSEFDVFDLIEVDSYHIDAFISLNITGDRRVQTRDVISRIWLIAAICRRSDAILAIKFVFSSEVRSQDVVDLICEAYTGSWTPKVALHVKDLKYSPEGGMPSYAIPEIRYHTWGGVALDNAMQHHATKVYELALHRIGFAINFGPLGQPARRPNIERLFKRIASKVMFQLPSTTGSSPADGDGRVEKPEDSAVMYQVDVDDAIEVMDVYTANYNGIPQGGRNKANSPLDIIRAYIHQPTVLLPASSQAYINTAALGSLTQEVTITGNIKTGIRPHIKLDKARYTSPQLANSPQLIGKRAIVRIDSNDYRAVEIYLKDGVHLGTVTVEAAWRDLAHTVITRKLINRALAKKEFSIAAGQNPVIAWQKHLSKNPTPHNNREQKRVMLEGQKTHELNPILSDDNPESKLESESTERWKTLDIFNKDFP